ncbi:MAG: cob(I)yrinic acid a,c-diamide adenosyltransferase, partial [Chromatiales bacterium]|nr:cob(I)yrinic acid a,c-diamide adenosyltransferase [Chromatiales bacterium]
MPRLTRIYTRTGDDGTTGLAGGARRRKDDARIEAIGTVDELNAQLGWLRAGAVPDMVDGELLAIQNDLFDLGAELAMPGERPFAAARVVWLEERLDAHNARLPPLAEFVLPGGNDACARAHVARTVCRRAERRLVALAAVEDVGADALHYLNRLSDYLFVLARVLARESGAGE